MAKKNNRKCIVCGEEYFYCPSCADRNDPVWRSIYHDANCMEIYDVTSLFHIGELSKEDAKKRLDKCDLSKKESFHHVIKDDIEEIYKVDKKDSFRKDK